MMLMMRRNPNSDGSSTTGEWQRMSSSLLPRILFQLFLSNIFLSGSCEGLLKTFLSPARIRKDSFCQLQRGRHPQSSYYFLFPPAKQYTNHALSYSVASLDAVTSTDTANFITTTAITTASNLLIPASKAFIPLVPTIILLVSDGFDPTGFFVNVLGGLLNGPG